VYYDKIVRHTAVIPFGGNVITEDIRHGCGVLQRQANDMKIQYGSCYSDLAENALLVIQGINGRGSREVSFKVLAGIIEARMEEIIEAVMFEIERSGYADKLSVGIVFTGGGAMIQHLDELVRSKTGMVVRIAKPIRVTDDSPKEVRQCSYSTAVGLLLKGIAYEKERTKEEILETVHVAPEPETPASTKNEKPAKPPKPPTPPKQKV
jgi:cell division protein FtsA